ncbi:hypothetical protein RR48_14381 [Papilio machaon]|uniref:Uncharacterized protein n=1 Tax=Papilio machaon TaxID=76193 RepID=A0A194QKL3_PAPMA|nr:hypothetical protein RR48_14381 [Papilio machaon]
MSASQRDAVFTRRSKVNIVRHQKRAQMTIKLNYYRAAVYPLGGYSISSQCISVVASSLTVLHVSYNPFIKTRKAL